MSLDVLAFVCRQWGLVRVFVSTTAVLFRVGWGVWEGCWQGPQLRDSSIEVFHSQQDPTWRGQGASKRLGDAHILPASLEPAATF